MNSTFRNYTLILGVSAVILTALVGLYPAIRELPFPSFLFLFLPSLAFDIYMIGRIPPLTGMDRGLGMIAACLFHLILTKFLFG